MGTPFDREHHQTPPASSSAEILAELRLIRHEIAGLRADVLAATPSIPTGPEQVAAARSIPTGGPRRSVGRSGGAERPRGRVGSRLERLSGVPIRYGIAVAAVASVLAWMLLANLGDNPAGFFCDEAEIGLSTRRLIEHDLPGLRPALFYHHFKNPFGALPLYAGAPVALVLGLSDFSVRLVSVLWSAAALVVLVALVRRLGWRHGEVAVVLFACTPIFLHLSRVNFGHAPSLFCVSLGLYAFVRARDTASRRWAVVSGLALGISAYGNPAYYLAAPVFVVGLVIGEITVSRLAWRSYRLLAVSLAGTALAWAPVLVKVLTDDEFVRRYREKESTDLPLLSSARLGAIVDNYGKYFDFDYLFVRGEVGVLGGNNLRHSVPGAGELTWIALPLVLAGIVAIFRLGSGTGRVIAVAGLVVMLLYPAPDITTTTSLNAPYSISVFSTMLFVPLLAGYGVHLISGWFIGTSRARLASWLLPVGLLAVIVTGAVRFHTGPYERYPTVSAEYYGWQYGPRQSIAIFREHADDYDRYLFDGDFNEAFIFLDFYLADDPELRAKARLGRPDQVNVAERQLVAVRAERYDALMSSPDPLRRYGRIVDLVRYPSGQIALYIVAFERGNDPGGPQRPW